MLDALDDAHLLYPSAPRTYALISSRTILFPSLGWAKLTHTNQQKYLKIWVISAPSPSSFRHCVRPVNKSTKHYSICFRVSAR